MNTAHVDSRRPPYSPLCRLGIALVSAMLFTIIPTDCARGQFYITPELSGGIAIPDQSDSYMFRIGPGASLGAGHRAWRLLDLVLLMDWNSNSLYPNRVLIPEVTDETGGRRTIIAATANLRARLTEYHYIYAGIGLSRLSSADYVWTYMWGEIERHHTPPRTAVVYQAGLGINLVKMHRGDLFIDARVVVGGEEGETTAFFPLRLGFRFN